ncbi:MAG: LacI family DNA-binding transcriptional regulator [Eubacteriales bacterium]|nr:LacI family DNA-binding transcriptional regulator [Eubacteriales bacterium]
MIVEPLIKNAYWCNRYIDGIKDEIKRNKGTLIELDFEQLNELIDYSNRQYLRPVLLVNCISRKWIYNCITRLNQLQIHPLLLAPYTYEPSTPISTVSFDFISVFYTLCQYMYDSGHQRIALFGVNPDSSNDVTKKKSFLMFASDYEINNASDNIFCNKGCLEKCCTELFNRINEFNAVICSNDVVAVKLINFLKEHNVEIPDDLFVATMGNTVLSKSIMPDITICEFNCEQIGRQAVKLSGILAKNPEISSLTATVTGEIQPRKSTNFHPFLNLFHQKENKIKAENINFYSDEDVSKIFRMEQLISNCDEQDLCILYGLICGKHMNKLAAEIFVTENTVKYRIKKMQNLSQTKSRKELLELFTEFFY